MKCYDNGNLSSKMYYSKNTDCQLLFHKVCEKVKVLNFAESKDQDKFSVPRQVAILVILVTSFFVFFALMAVCYRFVYFRDGPSNVMISEIGCILNVYAFSFSKNKWKMSEKDTKCLLDVLSTMWCWCR